VAAVLLVGAFYAYRFVQTAPSIGFGLDKNWRVTALSPCPAGQSDCAANGLRIGDRLLQIGDLSHEGYLADRRLEPMGDYGPGDVVTITLERDGGLNTIGVRLRHVTLEEQARSLIGFLPALVFWLAGVGAWSMLRPWDLRWHVFIWFNLLTALWLTTGPVGFSRIGYSEIVYRATSPLLAAVLLHFHLVMPAPLFNPPRWMVWALYGLAGVFAATELVQASLLPPFTAVAAAVVLSLILLIYRLFRRRGEGRVVARFMLAGIGLAFGPGVLVSLPTLQGSGFPSTIATYITLVATLILPLTYTYAIFKRNLGGLEARFNRFIVWYAFLVLYAAAGLTITQLALAWLAPGAQFDTLDLWIVGALLAVAFLTWPYFNRWLSRLALGVSYNSIEIERLVAMELPNVSRSEQIEQMLAHRVLPSLSIRQSALYTTFEGKVQPVCLTGFDGASPAVSIRQIEAWLAGGDRYRPPQTDLPDQPEWLRLILPLTHQGQRIGVWAFGRRDPDDFYTEGDIRLLKQISSQLALALENAHLYRELKESETALAAERASLAERVAEQTAELRAKNDALARALSARDAFFASMSHELRTPLNAILGLSEALQDGVYGPVTEPQVRHLASIEASGHHLLSLINDILDAAKLQHGTLMLNVSEVAVENLCRASLQFVEERARRKGLQLQLDVDSRVKYVHADARRLKQILINLLNNAVKFTPEGGQAGLTVTGHAETSTLDFTVWDTGIGITREDQARLFQPFVQLDSGLDRRFEGTGLGLALVQQLVQLHGGQVTVASEVGQGSRFTVTLPWQPPALTQQPVPHNGAISG